MLHEGHRASGSHDSVTDKIAQVFAAQTENPSADQTDGFGKQKYASIPLSPAQEQKIQRNKEEDERFLQSIQAYLRGDYGNETVFRVGTTPYCMRIVGAKAIPVVISQSVLFNSLASGKASKAHTEGHDIPPETLEKIPEAIRNPIFVCRGHRPDTLAVICDLTDKEQRNYWLHSHWMYREHTARLTGSQQCSERKTSLNSYKRRLIAMGFLL